MVNGGWVENEGGVQIGEWRVGADWRMRMVQIGEWRVGTDW